MLCNGLPCIALDLQRDAHLIYGFLLLILRVKIIDEINSRNQKVNFINQINDGWKCVDYLGGSFFFFFDRRSAAFARLCASSNADYILVPCLCWLLSTR